MAVLAKDLRNALLQSAFQGKLTEQLSTDSSVYDLIEAINTKKENMIASGEIKQEKPLPIIREDEIPFDIPDTWKWCRWGEIAYKIQYGYNSSSKSSGTVKMVRISDIQNNKVLWEKVPYCQIDDNSYNIYKLKKNDILFARTGGTVGKSFLLKDEIEDKVIFAGYLIRTQYDEKLVPQYLKYFMESELYWVQLRNGKTQGCQPNCNGKTLSKMIIPIPPIEEQKRIVDRIDELMIKIDEYEKVENKIEKLKKNFPIDLRDSILQAAMQGKLTEQLPTDGNIKELLASIKENRNNLIERNEIKLNKNSVTIEKNGESFFAISNVSGKKIDITEEIPFEIPDTWAWIKFGDLANQKMGKTPERANSLNWNMDNNWVSISDMPANGYLSTTKEGVSNDCLKKYFNDKKSPAGTLIMSFKLTVGRVSILNIPAVHNEAIISIYPYVNKDNICRDYLFKVLPMLSNYGNTKNAIKGKTLNSTSLYNLLIPLPPLEEQKRIVEKLNKLLPRCENL
ncbi:restriction endonuclease subunit S [Clostridium perfringens]|uniref:restriction endonuclease subunit S n=1 Tax=Clostridium perfringens TaxID=1502 RepID=UPI0024BCE166|nr:restriction endonuclease subunit S [Clostridium perfringens]